MLAKKRGHSCIRSEFVKRYISPIIGPRCPEGSWKLRFPDYVTMAQNVGKVVRPTHRPFFTPRKYSWYSFLLRG